MKGKESKYALGLLVLGVAYFVTAKFGLSLDAVNGFATPVWPPSGIALAALLLYGYRLWPAVAIAAFLVNLSVGASPIEAIGIAIGNTLEPLVGAYLLKRCVGFDYSLKRIKDVLGLIILAALASTMISATIGVTSLVLGGGVGAASFPKTWVAWWVGDMLGVLIVASFILVWTRPLQAELTLKKGFEYLLYAMALILFSIAIFSIELRSNLAVSSYAYLLAPPLAWASLRYGQRGMVGSIFIISFIAIVLMIAKSIANPNVSLSLSLILLQIFLGIAASTMMILAAVFSEYKEAKMNLESEISKFEGLLQSIGDGVVATDQKGKVFFMNTPAERLLGWTRLELIGKKFVEMVPLEHEDEEVVPEEQRLSYQVPKLRRTLTNTGVASPYYYRRKDKSRFPVKVTASPFDLNRGKPRFGAIVVFRDVTRETEIDRTKQDFVSLASHQLRTPLSIISMYSEILQQQGLPSESEREEYESSISAIFDGARRMAALIDDLLNVSRIDAEMIKVEIGEENIMKIIEDTVAESRQKANEKAIDLELTQKTKIPNIKSDKQLLRVIFQNLIANAIKYTPENGRVEIDVSSRGRYIRVDVSDTGYGIPKSQQSKVFERFFRADNGKQIEQEGTGLGLYIVKSFVERLGGSVTLASEEDKGSTFTVHLPLDRHEKKGNYDK